MAASINDNRRRPEIIRDEYSEPSQTSKMEIFANIADCVQPLTILQNTPH